MDKLADYTQEERDAVLAYIAARNEFLRLQRGGKKLDEERKALGIYGKGYLSWPQFEEMSRLKAELGSVLQRNGRNEDTRRIIDFADAEYKTTYKADVQAARGGLTLKAQNPGPNEEICSRCGGTGQYSYNTMHGTTCYGCQGHGVQVRKARKAR